MATNRFDSLVSNTIFFETGGDKSGAYTDDPNDSGRATKWGISQKAHPNTNIKTLTYKQAIAIYKAEYWIPIFDQVTDDRLLFKVFDMGVLMGISTATTLLQRALQKVGITVNIDGDFGPLTLAAVEIAEVPALYEAYISLLNRRAYWITFTRPLKKMYLKGWLNRIIFNYKGAKVANI